MLGTPVLLVGSLLSVSFLFLIIFLFFFFFTPGLCCMHTVQMLGLKWLTQGKTRSMLFVSLERDGSEQPCSLFVLFELCKSLLSQAETPDPFLTSDQLESGLFIWEMIAVSYAICKSEQERFLKSEECKQEICVRLKSCQLDLPSYIKTKQVEITLSPLTWISDTVSRQRKGPVSIFPCG